MMTGALRDPAECARRRAMLHDPHMAALTGVVASLRGGGGVPDFDPLDGGVAAEILLLLEKPGPTVMGGSGLVSRDNPTATAAAIRCFAAQAGLDRRRMVLWNTVPWWNGTLAVRAPELAAGLAALPAVLACLTRLRVVLLAGRTAGYAEPIFADWGLAAQGLAVVASAHPSPNVRAGHPALWHAIPDRWRHAHDHLDGAVCPGGHAAR